MKKRILIHAPNLQTPGGKQTYYAAVMDHFKSDIEFFFYGANGQKESKFQTISRMCKDYFLFYKKVKHEKYDLVHLNPSLNVKSFFRDSIFALICSLLNVKTLVFWHGWNWDFERKYIQKMQWYFRWTYGKSDAMIVLAKEFEKRIISYGYNKKIYLETTVVDDTIFNLVNSKNKSFVPKNNEYLELLFLARLEKEKGIYEAIDSFEIVQKTYPNTILNVAGVGGELEAAKSYVTKKEISNINFMGWITGKQKAEALNKAHIYILASSHGEGMPISLLEAMATGTPVVTTDVGGIKDFFEPDQMGLITKTNDAPYLAKQLESLIEKPQLMQAMGKFNIQYAKERFAPNMVTQRIESIYDDLADSLKQEGSSLEPVSV